MINRVSSNPLVLVQLWSEGQFHFVAFSVGAKKLSLKSDLLRVTGANEAESNEFQTIAALKQLYLDAPRNDESAIVSLKPEPPHFDERFETKLPVEYCRQWDSYYLANAQYKERKKALFKDQEAEQEALRLDFTKREAALAASPAVRGLMDQAVLLKSTEPGEERFFALYRGTVWACLRQLVPGYWQRLVDDLLAREDAQLQSLLVGDRKWDTRDRLTSEVRRVVWIRDQGKCVRCGSRDRLEYDHIIPRSRGGSSTDRNIELLCEACNRAKSDSIT